MPCPLQGTPFALHLIPVISLAGNGNTVLFHSIRISRITGHQGHLRICEKCVCERYYLRPLTWPPKHSSLNLTLSADPTGAQLCHNEGRDPTKSSRLLPPKYLKICSYSEFISAGSSTWSNNKLVGHPAKSSRKA
jgi:predicted nucleic-acid-binding Zn-ribbon protein